MTSSSTNSPMPLFLGEFRHSIDGKSRVTVPSEWRFEAEAEFFLMPTSKGDCLKAMPRWEVERIRAEAAQMTGPERLEVMREFGASVRPCKLDKAGRMVVPEEFCQGLNLSGEVTLVGAMETFEVWNSQARANAKSRSTVIANPHFARLGL